MSRLIPKFLNFASQPANYNAAHIPPAPRILVIRFKWIGDVMLTSVLCNSLKKSFPDSTVDYLMHEAAASLFDDHPFIDNVIGLSTKQHKNPLRYLATLVTLGRTPYDLIIDAQSTNKSELVCLFCATKKAICIGRYKPKRGRFYSHTENATPDLGHKIIERLSLLKPLAELACNIQYDSTMTITVPEQIKLKFQHELKNQGASFNQPLFVFAVTAKLAHKKWSQQQLQEVALHCLVKYKAQLVLFYGSNAEREDVHQFHNKMESNPNIISSIKTNNVMELAALIANCDLFVGNEGGPRHIAQSLGVASVAVFSPSAKKSEWLPSDSRAHQGLEWDDLLTKTKAQKAAIHAQLDIASEQYTSLYKLITAQKVIDLVDDVARFSGIKMESS